MYTRYRGQRTEDGPVPPQFKLTNTKLNMFATKERAAVSARCRAAAPMIMHARMASSNRRDAPAQQHPSRRCFCKRRPPRCCRRSAAHPGLEAGSPPWVQYRCLYVPVGGTSGTGTLVVYFRRVHTEKKKMKKMRQPGPGISCGAHSRPDLAGSVRTAVPQSPPGPRSVPTRRSSGPRSQQPWSSAASAGTPLSVVQ